MTASPPPSSTPFALLFADHDGEMARSRQLLALVPDGRNEWKPHEKSTPLGALATHLAELPQFATIISTSPQMDFAAGDWTPAAAETTSERLALFDDRAARMKASISALDWPTVSEPWVLRMGDTILMKEARARHLRVVYSHMTHHRAQLGVYLRLLGIAIPGAYGPSADER